MFPKFQPVLGFFSTDQVPNNRQNQTSSQRASDSSCLLDQQGSSSVVPGVQVHLPVVTFHQEIPLSFSVQPSEFPKPSEFHPVSGSQNESSSHLHTVFRRSSIQSIQFSGANIASNQASRRPQASHAKFTAAEPKMRSVLHGPAVTVRDSDRL